MNLAIAAGVTIYVDSVAIVAPVEPVVDTNFHHLDIAVVGGERIAGKERGRGRNDEGPVA